MSNTERNTAWFHRQSSSSFERIIPRLRQRFPEVPDPEWEVFTARMEEYFGQLFELLHELYSGYYDFFYHLENIMAAATRMWIDRTTSRRSTPHVRQTRAGSSPTA
jgi:amylosucrase